MPKVVDHDVERRRLARACFGLLAEKGYAGASMRQLAKAAGVSTGKLYHYFPDKQAILVHVFDTMITRDQARLARLLPRDAPPARRLSAVVTFAKRQRQELQDLLRLALEMVRTEPEPGTTEVVSSAIQRYRASLLELTDVDSPAVVEALLAMLLGTLVYDLLDPDDARFESIGLVAAAWMGASLPE